MATGEVKRVTLQVWDPYVVKVLGGLMKKYPFLSVVPLTLIGYFVLLHVNITSAPVYGQQISNLSQSNALLTCTRLMVKGLLFVLPNKKQSVQINSLLGIGLVSCFRMVVLGAFWVKRNAKT